MAWYYALILLYLIIAMIFSVLTLSAAAGGAISLEECYNPFEIYKNNDVNYFGCIVLTILQHLLMPIPAPFFWLYKLCTIGRK